jgi:hypothetical protein
MIIALLALAVAFAAETAHAQWIEWPESEGGNGHLYRLTAPGTWHEAEAEAQAEGGHLVTVDDESEFTWVKGTFCSPLGGWHWIGFNDEAEEGTWVWSSGEGGYWREGDVGSTSYVHWISGEPNDWGPEPGEDCAVVAWGGWYDLDANHTGYEPVSGIIEARDTYGDFDHDGSIDLNDFGTFAVCYGGANVTYPPPTCSPEDFAEADFDGDGDVDLGDFNEFSVNFTG